MRRIVAIIAAAVATLAAVPARAQELYPPEGLGEVVTRGIGDPAAAPAPDELALTGADIMVWVGIGVALIVLGMLVLRARRRASVPRGA